MNKIEFEDVFGLSDSVSFTPTLIESIRGNRRKFDGALFVDRLLQAVGLDTGHTLYPPQSHTALRSLFQTICETEAPDHHIQALLFYILQDLNPTNTEAAAFATRHHVLVTYRILIQGLWHLDHGRFEAAINSLTDPCLTPTFENEILSRLVRHGKNSRLALTYYSTLPRKNVSSMISMPFVELMAIVSPLEVLLLTRSQYGTMDARQSAFATLIGTVLNDNVESRRQHNVTVLAEFPLDPDEERWFSECVDSDRARDAAGAGFAKLLRGLSQRRTQDSFYLICGAQHSHRNA